MYIYIYIFRVHLLNRSDKLSDFTNCRSDKLSDFATFVGRVRGGHLTAQPPHRTTAVEATGACIYIYIYTYVYI